MWLKDSARTNSASWAWLGWITFCVVLGGAAWARATPIWTPWAGPANGVVAGTYPRLAIAPETHELYYSFATLPSSSTSGLGEVWKCNLNDPTHTFSELPQTGFTLPPHPAGQIENAFSLTTNSAGEPIVGCSSLNAFNTQNKIYRFDKAAQQWTAPPLSANSGQTIPALQPYEAMYSLTRAPNGTIWGGGQYAHVYRSTDGGKTFTVIDESALLAQTDPAYYPTRANGAGNNGAIYSVRVAPNGVVYAGTESAGMIYSADNGASWHPLDYDYTNLNSTMGRVTNLGNIAGVGFTKNGKVVVQGTSGSGASPSPDPTHLYLVDGANHTVQAANGFAPYFFGGQQVSQIVTTTNGTMFLSSNVGPTKADGTTGPGGIYTSTDGLNWTQANTGISSAYFVPAINQWIDANGHGSEGSLVVDGNDVYMATYDGRIWHYTDAPEAGSMGMMIAAASQLILRRRRRAL